MTHLYIKHIEANTLLDYDRPVFLLPAENSPECNTFFLFASFLKNLTAAGYREEVDFIQNHFVSKNMGQFVIPSNTGFSNNTVYGIVEFMNQFCSLEENQIIEETDDYILTRVKKNGKNGVSLKNPTLFTNPKLSIIKAMIEDPELKSSLLEKNTYGRNILYYLPINDALSLAKEDQDFLNSALDDDVFNQKFFSHKLSMENFKIVIKFLTDDLKQSPENIQDILSQRDAFRCEAVDYLLKNMDKNFPSLKDLSEKIQNSSKYNDLLNADISYETKTYIDIINTTYLLLKYDNYIGEKIHSCIFDKESPEYQRVGIYFDNALKAVEGKMSSNKEKIHPSFYEFSSAIRTLKLKKDLAVFDEANPNVVSKKTTPTKKKV